MPLEKHPPGLGVGVHSFSPNRVFLGKDEGGCGDGSQEAQTVILALPLAGRRASLPGVSIS